MEMDRKFMAKTRKSLFRGTISYRRSASEDKSKDRRRGEGSKDRRGGEGSRERRGGEGIQQARHGRTAEGNLRLHNQLKVKGTSNHEAMNLILVVYVSNISCQTPREMTMIIENCDQDGRWRYHISTITTLTRITKKQRNKSTEKNLDSGQK